MIKKIFILIFIVFAGISNIWAQDITPPAPVTIRYVDVDPLTGNVEVNWNPSSSVDVEGYEIYKLINGYYIKIGDVSHPTTSFVNTVSSPPTANSSLANSQIETYRVTAYDGVVPTPNISQLCNPHHTIYLASSFRPCYGEIQLAWNEYDTWLSGVYQYKIWYKVGSAGVWSELATIPGDFSTFTHNTIEADKDYFYYVEAFDGSASYSARSNQVTEYTDMPSPPSVFNANYASISEDDLINLSFTTDLNADALYYVLLRTDSLGADFDTIAKFDASILTSNVITYSDNAPTGMKHYYKMIAINTCGIPFSKTSNIASNIVLNVTAQDDLRNSLVWDNYYKWNMGISYFEVVRTIDYVSPEVVAEIPYGDTTYFDKIDEFLYDPNYNPVHPSSLIEFPNTYLEQPVISGKYCYYVKAYEGSGATLGNYTSNSNTVCVSQTPRVFIPNIFSPNSDGENDLFYPYVSLAGLNNYELRIYDRWGMLVFRTKYPHQGWNGYQLNGNKKAPVGSYVYYLNFLDGDNEPHTYSGSVLLIR